MGDYQGVVDGRGGVMPPLLVCSPGMFVEPMD